MALLFIIVPIRLIFDKRRDLAEAVLFKYRALVRHERILPPRRIPSDGSETGIAVCGQDSPSAGLAPDYRCTFDEFNPVAHFTLMAAIIIASSAHTARLTHFAETSFCHLTNLVMSPRFGHL